MFKRVIQEATPGRHRHNARRWLVVTTIVAGGLIAAACGSSSPSKSSTQTTVKHHSSGTTTSTTAATSTTTTAAGATTTTAAGATTTTSKSTTATTAKSTTPTTAASSATSIPATLGGSSDFNTPSAALTGAGSTFDQPLFSRQFYDFNKDDSKVTVNYSAVGSGAGETAILGNTVSFGASDVPEPAGTTGSGGAAILQIPVVLGGIAMAYNESCLGTSTHLTGTQIAQIYSGKITDWHTIDSSCPSGSAIEPVYRADSSGTSNAFTHYLTSVDAADWPSSLDGKQPAFPKGEGGNGNAGVAGDVQNGSGTIGYVELAYALQSGLNYAAVQNSAGSYVVPTLASVSADAAQFPSVSPTNYLIVNGGGASSYPISTYSWIIVNQKQSNQNNGLALGKLMDWMVTSGQSDASAIGYAPLPANIVALAESTIKQMENSSGSLLF